MDTKIKHPHRDAFPTLIILTALSVIVTLLGGILAWLRILSIPAVPYIAGSFGLFCGVILVIVWLLGLNQMRRTAAFLASDRVLVRWTYTPEEWDTIRCQRQETTRGDWKLALGCLTVIFAITGALTGVLIGLDDDLGTVLLDGALGLFVGGLIGGILGLAVGGGNALGAWLAYRDLHPEQIALGASEIFANDQYFRSHAPYRYILKAYWDSEDTAFLLYDLWNPKPRGGSEETWSIYVPSRMHAAVEAVLSQIVIDKAAEKTE